MPENQESELTKCVHGFYTANYDQLNENVTNLRNAGREDVETKLNRIDKEQVYKHRCRNVVEAGFL